MKTNQWEELNPRQQATLIAIYRADQNAESDEAARWRLGWERRKADVWRRLRYPPYRGVNTFLHDQLEKAAVIDPGLGSTLQSLERRELCECSYYSVRGKNELFSIKLTREGRSVARSLLEESAPKKVPKGQLKPRQWEAVQAAWNAGDEGIKDKFGSGDYGGFSWRWTWLRLRDYYELSDGLVEEVRYWKNGEQQTKLIITDKGKIFYQENLHRYLELYPQSNQSLESSQDVETPVEHQD